MCYKPGSDVILVSAIQARNNARIVFSGSLAMFSDSLILAMVSSSESSKKLAYVILVNHISSGILR